MNPFQKVSNTRREKNRTQISNDIFYEILGRIHNNVEKVNTKKEEHCKGINLWLKCIHIDKEELSNLKHEYYVEQMKYIYMTYTESLVG